MTTIRYVAATDRGKVRKLNEDSILALPQLQIWAVADGMGGHDSGDFASQKVVECISHLPADQPPQVLLAQLRQAIYSAHAQIAQEASSRDGGIIGSTVVTLILAQQHFAALWAGDSRLYCLRAGRLDMLTVDHSITGELVLDGKLTWEEAENHPHSNVITRAVGVGDHLELDKIRGDVRPGDRFLLCSDGLTKHVSHAQITQILASARLESAADLLIETALEAGGTDNVSAIVVEIL